MIRKNVKAVIAMAILSLAGLSSQAFSQNYCNYDNWTSSAGMQWWNNDIPTEYALSTDQISKINDVRANSSEKILPLQNELKSLRMEFRGYNSNSDADIQKIKSYRNKIHNLEDKISDINLDTRVQIKKMLSKEQLTYFNDGGYGWWNMADNCWHSNQNMMLSGERRMTMRGHGCCRW